MENKKNYIIVFEYTTGKKEEINITTSNLEFTLDQYSRNRDHILKYKIKEIR